MEQQSVFSSCQQHVDLTTPNFDLDADLDLNFALTLDPDLGH